MPPKIIRQLNHWVWAVPVLLAVAAFSIPRVDIYPPRTDEFFSMQNSGWTASGPFSTIDVLQSLVVNSPNHTPLYFILLHGWGNLVGNDIALGRLFSSLAGLLGLAVIYRAARDFIAPIGGLFAVLIVASSTFYNFYLSYLRMYTLLVLLSAIVVWLYLRIAHRVGSVSRREYAALFLASFALANTHAISALLFAAIGGYHLLHLRRNRRWLHIALVFLLSFALFSPWAVVLVRGGLGRTASSMAAESTSAWQLIGVWLSVNFAGSALLLAGSVVGLLLYWRASPKRASRLALILLYFLIALAATAHFTAFLPAGRLRYTLIGFVPLQLVLAAGFYGLYRARWWLGLFTLIWIAAGFSFHQSGYWTQFLSATSTYPEIIPWQAVSRVVNRTNEPSTVVGYQFDAFHLFFPASTNYPQYNHYFAPNEITVVALAEMGALSDYIRKGNITEPTIWLMYRTQLVDAGEAAQLKAIMRDANYAACDSYQMGLDAILIEYRWQALDCDKPAIHSAHESDLIQYEFFSAGLSPAGDKVLFVDRWSPMNGFATDRYKLSHQLINADGENVAQLDLPLVHEGILRQFSIDVGDAPAGNYRLVAILYHSQTGERYNWTENQSLATTMLSLSELKIPA